ncbi:DNA gyrase subunit A, partial [Candidatus Woesearchaeota archaeon]|nr:DNA gyrase subunit A [Candidatus Woesearchaeota archaeon]
MEEQRILPREIDDEMKTSYLDYAMSVLVGRALPDARDGLKPVHRRILYSMRDLGLLHNRPFRKSARIVGDCLGKYHPHGDTAVYDALVRMAQDFSLMHPLVHGQGNFGSVDGDNAAAMRYTEAKLSKVAEEILEDIDKETVDFVPNFDGSLKEPVVLPSKFPNLLVNGSSGIAVGMATNIPPHNLREVADAIIMQVDNPEITTTDLMSVLKGPDFPTGASIRGKSGIRQAYETGKGILRVRAKAEFEEHKDRTRIVVSEIPFQLNKSALIEEIAALVRDKKIGISDIRDESDRQGMRVVFELRKDANPQIVMNQLFSSTRLESTFGINLVALVDNQPRLLTIKELIAEFILHRKDVVKRRAQFEFTKATEKAHLLEGLIIALKNIDAVIKRIKEAADTNSAKIALQQNFSLSEKQALAILDMKLQRLSSLEQKKILEEHQQLLKRIKELKEILASEQLILGIIKKEMAAIREEYGKERKTQILEEETEYSEEDLIKPEDVVVTITHSGYVKRMPLTAYKQQRRGGKGIIAASAREGDFVEHVFVANTHSYILFFTDRGIVHWLKVYQIPEASRQAIGKAVVNLLELKGARITAFVPVNEFKEGLNLVMATKRGIVKKTELMAYSNPRKGGIIAITLDKEDDLINVVLTSGNDQIILATRNGMAVRFKETDVRATGRSSIGVRGIRMRDDGVVGMVLADESKTLLTVTQNGYGKRTPIKDYRLINRGGYGVINIQTSERNGKVVAIMSVSDSNELVFISRNGIMIRVPAKEISVIGRNTQGARIMRLEEGDSVVASAP